MTSLVYSQYSIPRVQSVLYPSCTVSTLSLVYSRYSIPHVQSVLYPSCTVGTLSLVYSRYSIPRVQSVLYPSCTVGTLSLVYSPYSIPRVQSVLYPLCTASLCGLVVWLTAASSIVGLPPNSTTMRGPLLTDPTGVGMPVLPGIGLPGMIPGNPFDPLGYLRPPIPGIPVSYSPPSLHHTDCMC